MAGSDIEKAFLEAAEIAKKLPKNLQEAGFNRAIEQLLGTPVAPNKGPQHSSGSKNRRPSEKRQKEQTGAADLVDSIDRTAHPDVGATSRVADRALKILHLADQIHGVDGLSANEIATILSRKFRLPTKVNSVLKALERETNTVDIRGTGPSRKFHIMAPGEAYLEKLRNGERDVSPRRSGGARARKRPKNSKQKQEAEIERPSSQRKTTKRLPSNKGTKATPGRPGPKAAIGQLLQAGYFQSKRTISDIQNELRHRRGHGYSVQELSPALVRSIREQSLARERNTEGQYEYTQI